jgi:hypothetical protein
MRAYVKIGNVDFPQGTPQVGDKLTLMVGVIVTAVEADEIDVTSFGRPPGSEIALGETTVRLVAHEATAVDG